MSSKVAGVAVVIACLLAGPAFAGNTPTPTPSAQPVTPKVKLAIECTLTPVRGQPNQATVTTTSNLDSTAGLYWTIYQGSTGTSVQISNFCRRNTLASFVWTASAPITDWHCHVTTAKLSSQCVN
jgi:hypothetical protein